MVYPGSIQVLHFDDLYGPPQDKICITVCVDPKIWFFLISRKISKFKRERPELLERQVLIDQVNHDFVLNQDSYINCTEIYSKTQEEVDAQIGGDMSKIRGSASAEVIQQIINAVDGNPELPRKHQQWILDNLNPLLEHVAK